MLGSDLTTSLLCYSNVGDSFALSSRKHCLKAIAAVAVDVMRSVDTTENGSS